MKRATADLRQIAQLLAEWDPIGVVKALSAAGKQPTEYDSYAPGVHTLLREGGSVDDLTSLLTQLRTESMGLPPSPRQDREAAERIALWWTSRAMP